MKFVSLLSFLLFASCQSTIKEEAHIFYLHGRIIELQGPNAISAEFGPYLLDDIIDSLQQGDAFVHYDVRTVDTDFQEYCETVSNQIDTLIANGLVPRNITVIGASKGAVMAMYISDRNPHPINYILLGANNSTIERENEWNLHGRILGIYERSDSLAGKDYQYWIDRSTNALQFQQLGINTGLGHGFLYQPLEEWLHPTRDWINNNNN